MTSDDTTGDSHSRYEPGLQVRREVMGDEFVDKVVPLLQERGSYRTDYEGQTLRDNLFA